MKRLSFRVSVCCGMLFLVILSASVVRAQGRAYYSGVKYHEAVRRITTPTFTLNRVKKIEKKLYHRKKKRSPYFWLNPSRCVSHPSKCIPSWKKKTNRSSVQLPSSVSTLHKLIVK